MEDKKKHVNGHAERNKKPPVPNIKVSKPNSTSKTRDKLHETIGKSDNNKATLTVAPAARSRSRDKHSERLSKSAPDNNRASNTVNSSSKSQDKENDSSKPKTKDTLQNDKSESKETKKKTNVNSTNNDKSTKQNDTKSDAPPAGRMRRAASIDVGELGRKKKTKRKKIKVDQETLLAEHTASKENLGQVLTQRSGSLGNRPNSLKLQNNANAVFPTPDPVKRHSTPVTSQRDRKLSTTSNSLSPDIPSKDTSAILPNQSKLKLSKWRKSDAETVEFSDPDDCWYSTFSSHQGYRKHGLKYTFPNAPYSRIPLPVIRKRWLNFIISIVYAIFAVVLFCPFAAFFIVLFPLCVFLKQFLKCCCSCCTVQTQGCCVCGQSLSVTEKFWVHTERQSPQVVQSLVIVEFGLSVSQVVNLVNNRVVLAEAEDGSSLYPKFSQRVVQTCSDFIWQEDQRFFIHNHVFEMPRGLESLEELQDYISDMASKPLPFDRPLWEVHILTDFGDVRDTVLLFRMHPCLVDGVSMVKILYKSIADVEPVTTVPPKVGKQNCIDSIKSIFNGPIKLFSRLLLPRNDFNLLHGEHVQLSGKKVITWSEPFSLSSAVKIKQVTRSTLNEVFMSVAAGSIRNYMIVNGVQNPFDIQSSIPVYYGANKHPSGVGNDVLMMKVTLPTNTEGVVPRLWQMKQQMDQIRESSMFAITRRIFKVSYHILSESLWNRLWIYILRKCTCIVSSLPGPEIKLRMSSKQIKTIFYWFPPVRQVALAISFFTYGDQIQMAVSSDQAMLPNPDLLTKDFVFQMQALYDQLGHRRVPGEQHNNRKFDPTLLNTEIRPEETATELKKKMSLIHQEIKNLRHKLDARRQDHVDDDHKMMKKIETLKEQFRELLVEMRKRKAAEAEVAMSFSEEDSADDDDIEIPRRPFRRRAMSVSSRMSTVSISSTVRPLPAPTPAMTPDYSPDSPLIPDKQVPYSVTKEERKFNTIPYASRRPSGSRLKMEDLEIIEYQYSPSFERRYKSPT